METENSLRANDLLKIAGLTYRQLNDWDERAGILSSDRSSKAGWRRFTGDEALALCICAKLRNQFSIPLEKLHPVLKWLLGKTEDNALQKMKKEADRYIRNAEKQHHTFLNLDEESLQKALKDESNRLLLSEYRFAKIKSLANLPVRYAYALVNVGTKINLVTDFNEIFRIYTFDQTHLLISFDLHNPLIVLPLSPIITEFKKVLETKTPKPDFSEKASEGSEPKTKVNPRRSANRKLKIVSHQGKSPPELNVISSRNSGNP